MKTGGGEPRPYRVHSCKYRPDRDHYVIRMPMHNRRSIRLKGYDYSQEGLYFITICTQDRQPWFGHITNGIMNLNEYGTLADAQWLSLPDRFPDLVLAEHQIMPNHMHGLIQIAHVVGAGFTPAREVTPAQPANPAPTVGQIVGAYKSLVAKTCLAVFCERQPGQQMGKLWQRNYYEHIVRNETAHQRIATYILDNPARWSDDMFYMDNLQNRAGASIG